jgi:hypothetical protein
LTFRSTMVFSVTVVFVGVSVGYRQRRRRDLGSCRGAR